MLKTIKRLAASVAAALTLPLIAAIPLASAAGSPVVVTPGNTQGWIFNGDPTTATPYEFNDDQASIGGGSLFVPAIGANAPDKFIAALPLNMPVPHLSSIAYDFLIAGTGDATDANQFYLNVYTKLSGSTNFYDCRFDYVPTTGSTASFTTATFAATDTPVNVADRPDAFTCPATLAAMPGDSTVSFIALNVGDTSTSDVGLAGYLDKVVVTVTTDSTTYDFEALEAPMITSPANGTVVTSAELDKIDWTDVTDAANYEYQAFSDAGYTSLVYASGLLAISEIPTPGTPEGNYYLRVRAVDGTGNTSAWSNGATSPYLVTVDNTPVVLTNKDQCKNGGWMTSQIPVFKNQGDCVSSFASQGKAKGNPL